jgi:hypothetical protein
VGCDGYNNNFVRNYLWKKVCIFRSEGTSATERTCVSFDNLDSELYRM